MKELLENNIADIDILIVGICHDLAEDTTVTLDVIQEQFGEMVRKYVDGLTKRIDEEWHVILNRIAKNHPEVVLVKLADRIDNLGDGFHNMKKRTQNKYMNDIEFFDKITNNYNIKNTLVSKLEKIHSEKFD